MNLPIERISYDWSEDSIRYINNPTLLAKQTYLYVQEIGDFKTKPAYFTERKNLNSYLIILTLSGTGYLKYQNMDYELHQGDIVYINCSEYHYYQCMGDTWEFLWVHFNGICAQGYYNVFSKDGFQVISMKDRYLIENTMRRLLMFSQNKDNRSEPICSNLINTIATELIINNIQGNMSVSYIPESIKNIAKYLDEHFTEELTLELIANQFGFSKYHISHEFKKYFGITYSEYLIGLRINLAKELLKYSDYTVNDITFLCGMNHVSHFINLFKVREEMTPLQYRKAWKINTARAL